MSKIKIKKQRKLELKISTVLTFGLLVNRSFLPKLERYNANNFTFRGNFRYYCLQI